LAASNLAGAQALQDPTRPPAGLPAGQGPPPAAAPVNRQRPRLQSVLIAREPGGRHLAVIDGETCAWASSYKGARVARIGDRTKWSWCAAHERQVLKLYAAAPAHAGGIERLKNE
jgi:MSHA biogenesis protein MshK